MPVLPKGWSGEYCKPQSMKTTLHSLTLKTVPTIRGMVCILLRNMRHCKAYLLLTIQKNMSRIPLPSNKVQQPASLLPWMGQIFHDEPNNVVPKHLPPFLKNKITITLLQEAAST